MLLGPGHQFYPCHGPPASLPLAARWRRPHSGGLVGSLCAGSARRPAHTLPARTQTATEPPAPTVNPLGVSGGRGPPTPGAPQPDILQDQVIRSRCWHELASPSVTCTRVSSRAGRVSNLGPGWRSAASRFLATIIHFTGPVNVGVLRRLHAAVVGKATSSGCGPSDGWPTARRGGTVSAAYLPAGFTPLRGVR